MGSIIQRIVTFIVSIVEGNPKVLDHKFYVASRTKLSKDIQSGFIYCATVCAFSISSKNASSNSHGLKRYLAAGPKS